MVAMDVFNSDAFSMMSLTAAIERTPYVPNFLGSLNIFTPKPVTTRAVAMEEINGRIALIQTDRPGAAPATRENEKRKLRYHETVRLAQSDTLYAETIQGIRAFGSETEMQTMMQEWARRTATLRRNMELTHEWHRLGAIQGLVLDADGTSVIVDWFTFWGIDRPAEFDFALGTATTDVRGKCMAVRRAMERAAKGMMPMGTAIHALAGDEFFDALIDHDTVRATYLNWAAAADLRNDLAFRSFNYGGITFHNYRGTDDNSLVSVAGPDCKFFPVGAPDIFEVAHAPGEWFGVVNTPGRPLYQLSIVDRDRMAWVKNELYSYPLYICTTPGVLQRATANAS